MYQIDVLIEGDNGDHDLEVDYQIHDAEPDVGVHGGPEIRNITVRYKGRERRLKGWGQKLDEYLCNHIEENE